MEHWTDIPVYARYSQWKTCDKRLLRSIREVDPLLDVKFHMPTEKWHLVRYPKGFSNGKFVTVWVLDDLPQKGLRPIPGEWMIDALKSADTRRKSIERRVREIDASNAAIEAAADKRLDDACRATAEDMRKPLQAMVDGESSYKGVF